MPPRMMQGMIPPPGGMRGPMPPMGMPMGMRGPMMSGPPPQLNSAQKNDD